MTVTINVRDEIAKMHRGEPTTLSRHVLMSLERKLAVSDRESELKLLRSHQPLR